ncbi:Alpha/Beta hydrolase protein [Naematelia encephala]|uniref:Alpha/Beta hydrolase protein n=1 Tax=Naematelia encephala TaxID=71784 RepID=A0A1Y2BA79_9TREE|nr:Alpha/Beta hydrolase protein [Naematelia encephala]
MSSRLLPRKVRVNDSDIHVVETIPDTPSAAPTIVLVSGLGYTAATWAATQRLLPTTLRTFAYDRLGLNNSDPTTLDRHASLLAQELKDTLTACNVPTPYLLVGWSYGGCIIREYLEAFDEDVAGLVYVDANHERSHVERQWPVELTFRLDPKAFSIGDQTGLDNDHRCTSEEWDVLVKEQDRRNALAIGGPGEWTLYAASLDALGEHRQLDRRALGNRPISVIQANTTRDFQRILEAAKKSGRGTAEDHQEMEKFIEHFTAVELRLNYDMLRLSNIHRMVITSISGHFVPWVEPQLCVEEIKWCLDHLEKSH